MKSANDFFAWFKSVTGISPDATASEAQQQILDQTQKTTETTAEVVDTIVKTETPDFAAQIATMQAEFDALKAERQTAAAALESANARITELEREPATAHTNGPDDLDDDRPSASKPDKELSELGEILKMNMRAYR